VTTPFKNDYRAPNIASSLWQKYDSNNISSFSKLKEVLASEYRIVFVDRKYLGPFIEFYKSGAGKPLRSRPYTISEYDTRMIRF